MTKIEMLPPTVIIQLNSKPKMTVRTAIYKNMKLSEVKLHVKAYPYKHLDNDCAASKRLYLFDKIRINNTRGQLIFEHKLPEVIELDNNYSVKLSDIFHDDIVVDGVDIFLERNDRPFEITELYLEYIELPATDEESPSVPFCKYFEKTPNLLNDNVGQKYYICLCENHNMSTIIPEFKYQRISKENDVYYISKYNYENDIEWILIDGEKEINKNIKKIEDYIGHKLFIKIKPTSNVEFLSEIKYFR